MRKLERAGFPSRSNLAPAALAFRADLCVCSVLCLPVWFRSLASSGRGSERRRRLGSWYVFLWLPLWWVTGSWRHPPRAPGRQFSLDTHLLSVLTTQQSPLGAASPLEPPGHGKAEVSHSGKPRSTTLSLLCESLSAMSDSSKSGGL